LRLHPLLATRSGNDANIFADPPYPPPAERVVVAMAAFLPRVPFAGSSWGAVATLPVTPDYSAKLERRPCRAIRGLRPLRTVSDQFPAPSGLREAVFVKRTALGHFSFWCRTHPRSGIARFGGFITKWASCDPRHKSVSSSTLPLCLVAQDTDWANHPGSLARLLRFVCPPPSPASSNLWTALGAQRHAWLNSGRSTSAFNGVPSSPCPPTPRAKVQTTTAERTLVFELICGLSSAPPVSRWGSQSAARLSQSIQRYHPPR